jgi:hypothetical protein
MVQNRIDQVGSRENRMGNAAAAELPCIDLKHNVSVNLRMGSSLIDYDGKAKVNVKDVM